MDWLRAGDVSVRQHLRSAYQQLGPPARQAFRGLGRAAGSDVTVTEMASHTGTSPLVTAQLLETLVDAGLLQVSPAGAGYRVPALFAAFARELASPAAR